MSTRNISIGTYNVTPLYFSLVSSGTNDPRFKRAWNAYTFTKTSYLIIPSSYGYWLIPPSKIITWTSDDEARLNDKIIAAVRGHSFNMGVFIGQSHEVASSVVSTSTAIIQSVRSLKRGDLEGAIRALGRTVPGGDKRVARKRLNRNDVAGTWLAMQYGWLPLLSDVHAASKAFEALSAPPRKSRIVVSRSKSEAYSGNVGPCKYSGNANRFVRVEIELSEELSYARSMGLSDPASVAWELLPWSFVADWFFPVGRYLAQQAVIPHLAGKAYWTAGYASVASFTGTVINPTVNYKYVGISGSRQNKHLVRYAPTGLALDVPTPKFVGVENIFKNATRVGNAIALLSQVFKGGR